MLRFSHRLSQACDVEWLQAPVLADELAGLLEKKKELQKAR